MKKYLCMALALLAAASLFTGCGCTNRNVSDNPNGMITKPTTVPTTNPTPTMTTPPEETTRPTTAPTTEATVPTTDMTLPGGMDDSAPTDMTDGTGTATEGARSRGMMPRRVR